MGGERSAPICGSCPRCGCALGFHATLRNEEWICCAPCAESDACFCGCQPSFTRPLFSDDYVPLRRMFGDRYPDELRHDGGDTRWDQQRAFPFADRRRGH